MSNPEIKIHFVCDWLGDIGTKRYEPMPWRSDEPRQWETIQWRLQKPGESPPGRIRKFVVVKVDVLNSPSGDPKLSPMSFVQREIEVHLEPEEQEG